MNCTGVEKLLPLYVEGDMTEDESVEVRAHLSACEHCFQLSEEFSASQSRLHNFAAPDFGSEFYEQIRGAVLAEITAPKPAAPSFPSVIAQLRQFFTWRPALAVSFALLLILCGVISYGLYNSLQKPDAALASLENSRRDFILEIKEAEVPAKNATQDESPGVREQRVTTASNTARGPQTGGRLKALPESPAPEKNETVAATTAANASTNTAQPPQKEESGNPEPSQTIARMEIQTSDPNIRIIWLAPKKGE